MYRLPRITLPFSWILFKIFTRCLELLTKEAANSVFGCIMLESPGEFTGLAIHVTFFLTSSAVSDLSLRLAYMLAIISSFGVIATFTLKSFNNGFCVWCV